MGLSALRLWRGRAQNPTSVLGRRGERLAARRLRRAGYRILERNLRVGRDEADVIAIDPDGITLVIVEVKTRAGEFAAPEVNVDDRKRRCLRRLAMRLSRMPRFAGRPIRFDVVSVLFLEARKAEVKHFVGAF